MFSYTTLGAGTPLHFHRQPHAHQPLTPAHYCAPRTIASKPIASQTRTCLHAAVIEQKTAEFRLALRFLMSKASFLTGGLTQNSSFHR